MSDYDTIPSREPLRFEFTGYTLWIELEQFESDLDHIIQVASKNQCIHPIPTPHLTLFYGMEHFQNEGEVLSMFNGEFKKFLEDNKFKWPSSLKPKAVLSDIAFDGVNGEVMDMAWSEMSFVTSDEHEKMLDTIYRIFHRKIRNPDDRWVPHLSLAYDNPENTTLSFEHAASLLSRFPTLLKDRQVKAISLWSTYGKMADWKCLDRIHLNVEPHLEAVGLSIQAEPQIAAQNASEVSISSRLKFSRRMGYQKNGWNAFSMMSKDGSKTLNVAELYSFLIRNGILVSFDAVVSLFRAADVGNNGTLTMEQFTDFFFMPAKSSFVHFVFNLLFSLDWWCVMCFFFGGLMFGIGAFPNELNISKHALNIFLAGDILFFLGGLRFVVPYPIGLYRAEKSFERIIMNVREKIEWNALTYISPGSAFGTSRRKFGTSRRKSVLLSPHSTAHRPSVHISAHSKTRASAIHISPHSAAKRGSLYLPLHLAAGALPVQDDCDDKLNKYVKEVIFSENATLTKKQFEVLLTNKVGAVTESLMDRMFEHANRGRDGKITPADVLAFLRSNPQTSIMWKLYTVTRSILMDFTWLASICFIAGEIIDALINIVGRPALGENVLWANAKFTPYMAAYWLFLIGCQMFIKEEFDRKTNSFDMEDKVIDMLNGKPLKELGRDFFHSHSDSFSADQLIQMLEESGIYIPLFIINRLFKEIDTDSSGGISKEELGTYLQTPRRRLLTILWRCLKSMAFMSNFVWLLGSVAYVVSAYTGRTNVANMCYQIGGVGFFLGGLTMSVNFIIHRMEDMKYEDNVRSAVEKIGMERSFLRRREGSLLRMSV
mmetsp:Transcript_35603/g.70073  ORF Transcript_35603/g.70073 Transcript_35603/m.70073 type:complete len:827 (+) Transcript_35603:171-2651(+)